MKRFRAEIEQIFERASQISDAAQRAAYLRSACREDEELLREVVSLLSANSQAEDFLVKPAGNPEAAADLTRPLAEKPGDCIGRYRLLEPIGEGGCGRVYLAEQREPVNRRVAFKVIKLGMDTRQVIARFEAERQALALMDHPNIARVFDGGSTESGRPYFVMELVRGTPMTQYCDEHKLTTRERLELFIAVCQAVQHAHQKGVIHRDLKPSNILVTEIDGKPVPKVIDFGVARATAQRLTEKTLFTHLGQMIGTPAYMSPEQADLGGLDIDTRSDVYSLGVVLYELLTGRTPFDTRKLLEAGYEAIVRTIREVEPPRPSTRLQTMLRADLTTTAQRRRTEALKLINLVRGDLDWIVMKCLEKDRARRYETANGLVRDIQRHLGNEPVVARPPSRGYRLQKLVRRHFLTFAASGAVAMALVLGLCVATWALLREQAAHQRAVAAELAEKQSRQEAEKARANEANLRLQAEANEKKAQSEASKSQQVARLLKEMLESVDPAVALGRDTTLLREILDKTAKRISQDLKDQPEVEAELSYTLGAVYWGVGAYEKAEALFRRLLELRRKQFGGEHPQVASALNDLGVMLESQLKLKDAESIQREALDMRRRVQGNEHLDVAESLMTLASVLWRRGELGEAETLNREATAMYQKLLGEDHPQVARSLNNLATVLHNAAKFDEAEKIHRQVLAIHQKLLGPQHPEIATSLNNLASVLQDKGDLSAAETVFKEALDMGRKLMGKEHPLVATVLDNLAMVLADEGKFAEAETLEHESLAMRRRLSGPEHGTVVASLNGIAIILRLQRKWAEAEAVQREALGMGKKVLGEEHPSMLRGLGHLALILREQGKLTEAEAASRARLDSMRARLPKGDARLAEPVGALAATLMLEEQFTKAESLAREWLNIAQEKRPDHWGTFYARSLLGACLLGQKNYAAAEPLLLEGYEGMRQRAQKLAPAIRSTRMREALQRLVQLYEEAQRHEQANEWKEKLSEFDKPGPDL